MLRKLLISFAMVLGLSATAFARDTYVRDVNTLPQAARTTIDKFFKGKVSLIKIDRALGMVDDYEVVLTDGTEIDFDSKGNWEKVETSVDKSVPDGLLPKALVAYVSKNFRGQKIVGAEKERRGYDIELANGIDLKFDADGNFIRFD